MRGVKALDTRPRIMVCSGGSRKMKGRLSLIAWAISADSRLRPGWRPSPLGRASGAMCAASTDADLERSTSRQSAWRVSTQNPPASRCTGDRSRSSA